MRKIVLSILLCMITCSVFAETRRYYCEVKGIERELGTGLKIIFDFGENASYAIWGSLSSKLKFVDENGEIINFHSMVDAANYMVEKGWIFQQTHSSVYSGKYIECWIFYKDATSPQEAKKGILTEQDYMDSQKNKYSDSYEW